MDPTLEQLARYIMQELGRGVPEPSLRASLIQHGWTPAWIDAAFRQIQGYAAGSPPASQPLAPAPGRSRRPPKFLVIVLALILVAVVVAFVVTPRLARPAQERAVRDAARQGDLEQLLSDLSDYYVAQNKYPTLEALNDSAFRDQNGFKGATIQDPQWSPAATACAKGNKAMLAASIEPHCYAYRATTSEGAPCNNVETPCTRMTLTVLFERESAANRVTFDRNNEVEE